MLISTTAAEHWYTNGTVIGIAGVAVGLVAIVVAIVLWRFGTPRGLLEYGMPVSKALVSGSPNLGKNDLQITFRGQAVKDPYLTTVNITNRGRRDIRSSDFDQNRPFALNMGTEIIALLSSPDSNDKLISIKNTDGLSLSPTLIRRKRQIVVNILTEGPPTLTSTDSLADVTVRSQLETDKLKENTQDIYVSIQGAVSARPQVQQTLTLTVHADRSLVRDNGQPRS